MTSRVAVRDANPVKVCYVHNTPAVTSYRTPSCDVIVAVARVTVRTRPTPTMYPEEKDVITSKSSAASARLSKSDATGRPCSFYSALIGYRTDFANMCVMFSPTVKIAWHEPKEISSSSSIS